MAQALLPAAPRLISARFLRPRHKGRDESRPADTSVRATSDGSRIFPDFRSSETRRGAWRLSSIRDTRVETSLDPAGTSARATRAGTIYDTVVVTERYACKLILNSIGVYKFANRNCRRRFRGAVSSGELPRIGRRGRGSDFITSRKPRRVRPVPRAAVVRIRRRDAARDRCARYLHAALVASANTCWRRRRPASTSSWRSPSPDSSARRSSSPNAQMLDGVVDRGWKRCARHCAKSGVTRGLCGKLRLRAFGAEGARDRGEDARPDFAHGGRGVAQRIAFTCVRHLEHSRRRLADREGLPSAGRDAVPEAQGGYGAAGAAHPAGVRFGAHAFHH